MERGDLSGAHAATNLYTMNHVHTASAIKNARLLKMDKRAPGSSK